MRLAKLTLPLILIGCVQDPVAGTLPTDPVVTPPIEQPPPDPVGVNINPEGDATLRPPPAPPVDPARSRRRMDLEQLDRALRVVTGGLGWTERRGTTDVNLFDELASTLGRPDYIQTTDEDLEPSAMFQKFLDDAARSVCGRLMVEDSRRPAAERTFFVHAAPETRYGSEPAKVQENLRALLMRFHGRNLGVDAPELEPWLWLMRGAEHVTDDQVEVWRTVCVGLITHPDFYTY